MAEYTCGRDKERVFDSHEMIFDLAGATLDQPLSSWDKETDSEVYYAKLENAKLLVEDRSVEEIEAMIDNEIDHMVLERLLEEEIDNDDPLAEKLRRAIQLHDKK